LNFQQLTTFCAVLAEGSMTRAAEKLFLTQPAVSQQIRNLEEELGAELLVRGSRQARATDSGQILFGYAKRIIDLNQQAQVAIHTVGQEVSGTLRIGTLNSMGLYSISPVVGLFLKHNDKLNIRLSYGDGESLIEQFKNKELDIIIIPDAQAEYGCEINDCDKRLLLKDEIWLVGSTKDDSLPDEIKIDEIEKRPLVWLSQRYPCFQNRLKEHFTSLGVEATPVFETTNVGTIKRVIESGLGWGFLPAHSIRKHVRSGRMKSVPVTDFQYPINVQFYSHKPKNEQDNRVNQIFFRALKRQIQSKEQ